MTDEQMDARLRAAGERWRAANTAVASLERPELIDQPADVLPPPTNRRRRGLIASAAVVAAALVAGGTLALGHWGNGGSGPSGDAAALEGHVWLLQGVPGTSSTATLYVDRHGNLVADDECQLIGGKVAVDGNTMTVTDQVRRFKSCADQYGPGYYDVGAAALDGKSSFGITSDGLTIKHGDTTLRFLLAPENTPAPTMNFPTLVGANWALLSAKDAHGRPVQVAGRPTLHITDSGTLSASDGCEPVRADAAALGPKIRLDDIVRAQRNCPAGTQTGGVFDFFSAGSVRQTVAGGELTLTRGAAQLVYRWAPDSPATDPTQLHNKTWTLIDNAGTAVPAGAGLSVCSPTSIGCTGCVWAVSAGTMRASAGLGCQPTDPVQKLFGDRPVVWSVYSGRLLLYLNDAQGSALVFSTNAPPPTTAQLVGPTWQLTSIKAGDGRYRKGAPPAETSTLTFTASGFADKHVCYGRAGAAQIGSATVTISNAHNTYANPCPFQPGRDEAANFVDSILTGTLDWSIHGPTLTLRKGASTLTYSTPGAPPSSNDPLTGTDWRLETAVDGNGTDHAANGLALRIDNGKLVADDGANAINAEVNVDSGSLTLSNVAVGGVGGTQSDPVTEIVDTVLQQGQVEFQIVGDVLTLTGQDQRQLIYRAGQVSGAAIVGGWQTRTIQHGTGPGSRTDTAKYAAPLTFVGTGVVFAACGTHTTATLTDHTIQFSGSWIATSNSCPPGNADEPAFVLGKLLTGTCTYTIAGNQLTITKDGVGTLVLTRAP